MKEIKYWLYRLEWRLAKWIVPKRPIHLDIELTSACNLKCIFCPQSDKEKTFTIGTMDFELFKKIIDQAVELKVPSIKLNLRGESTLHPLFTECAYYVKDKFVDIRLNTNGNYNPILNTVLADCFTEVCFSVDALYKPTYKQIRKSGSYHNLYENIIDLYDERQENNVKIVLSFVKTSLNKGEVGRFTHFWRNKYPEVSFFIRDAAERTKISAGTPTIHTDGNYTSATVSFGDREEYMCGDDIAVGRKDCLMPRRRMTILFDGRVLPCCVGAWDEKKLYYNSNIKVSKIKELWEGISYLIIRKDLKTGTAFDSIPMCKNCYSRESYIWKKK